MGQTRCNNQLDMIILKSKFILIKNIVSKNYTDVTFQRKTQRTITLFIHLNVYQVNARRA